MGGWSSERPVSLSSGEACANALEAEGYRVTRVDVNHDVSAVLSELKPDVAFNALHGPYGEDGTIQGVLEYLEIPYTHSGVFGFRSGDGQGAGKDDCQKGRHNGCRRQGYASAQGGQKARHETAPMWSSRWWKDHRLAC